MRHTIVTGAASLSAPSGFGPLGTTSNDSDSRTYCRAYSSTCGGTLDRCGPS
jgi:hypothetical protein